MQRYPKSNEAMQARDRLRKLGVATTGAEARETTVRGPTAIRLRLA